jgi:hypothetical protein
MEKHGGWTVDSDDLRQLVDVRKDPSLLRTLLLLLLFGIGNDDRPPTSSGIALERGLSQERASVVVDKENGKTVIVKMEKHGGWTVDSDL